MKQGAPASNRVALRVHWVLFGLVVGSAVVWWLVFRTARVAMLLGIVPQTIRAPEYAASIGRLYEIKLIGVLLGLLALGTGLFAAVKVKSPWTAGWLAIAAYGATMLCFIGTLHDIRGKASLGASGWAVILVYVALSAFAVRREIRKDAA